MANPANPVYKVVPFRNVTQLISELAAKATLTGSRQQFITALEFVNNQLTRDPLAWGDPLYSAKKEGGRVLRGFHPPLMVHYVVFEAEKLVGIWIIEFFPAPPTG